MPDEAMAQSVYQAINAYFPRPMGKRAPWQVTNQYEGVDARGRIQCHGRQITLDLQFYHIEHGFPALITYLEKHGCTGIEYTFTEEAEWRD